jgi:hypothetical protein
MKALFFALLVVATSFVGGTVWSEAELEGELGTGIESAPAAPESEALPEQENLPAPSGTIERSTFTTAIVEREPQDTITTLSNDQRKVFYFTELRDFQGTTVTHRWEYQGEPVAEVFFNIRGPRWRVYSSKNLPVTATGEWAVSIVDETNQVLQTDTFLYTEEPEVAREPLPTHETMPVAIEENGSSAENGAPAAVQD